ncbi:MAG TPA: 4Fe-4S dicluster domain-containing protein [Tepidisphaeraceae bacterium]|jgi:ferredoxin-type protein NapF
MDENRPINRRRFFREGLRELLRPLAASFEPIERAAEQLAKLEGPEQKQQAPPPETEPRRLGLKIYLRPPGAAEEKIFAEKCTLCGDCVRVCPVQAIKIDPTKEIAGGLPYIDADVSPCTVCSGLYCMHSCPTEALVPVSMRQIKMGLARWDSTTCLRSKGESCTACVDECPLGSAAIEILGPTVHVIDRGCVGCGVCQHVCPTAPKSIVVSPPLV